MENDVSYQVHLVLQMSGVIQFTGISYSTILWILFEVSTDTAVVQVAQKLAVIKFFDVFCCNPMIYQTSFSKEK